MRIKQRVPSLSWLVTMLIVDHDEVNEIIISDTVTKTMIKALKAKEADSIAELNI